MKQNQPVDGYVTLQEDKDTHDDNDTASDVAMPF